MFYYINGVISEMEPNLAVVDCGGVGYAVNTTANTLSRLSIGEKAKLYTYCNIREDCFDIYGFYSQSEKRCFELLIGVSGVGPRAALSILSSGTPESLAMAIVSGNEKALTVAPGVGKKLASRVILELKDKMAKLSETSGAVMDFVPAASVTGNSNITDATAALTVLGYSAAEINSALRNIDTENLGVEEIVRQVLKQMMK